jgi:predicted nucleotidyltransferase component of viral defense system
MKAIIEQMLRKYSCQSVEDYEQALKEIIQEIALLGLWRAKFFEIAAFYGGSALRILYGLERFSEDLDFSLLKTQPDFDIFQYRSFLQQELESFGFEVTVEKIEKSIQTPIDSAFIKANTAIHLLRLKSPLKTARDRRMKIKLEVDTDPPGDHQIEVKQHFSPIPYSLKTFTLPTLFAGKITALLFRPYKFNVKGRDWYDFLWYVSMKTPLDVAHLKARMVQLAKWPDEKPLSIDAVKKLMRERIAGLDLDKAKADVLPFVKDHAVVENWTKDLFRAAVELMEGQGKAR